MLWPLRDYFTALLQVGNRIIGAGLSPAESASGNQRQRLLYNLLCCFNPDQHQRCHQKQVSTREMSCLLICVMDVIQKKKKKAAVGGSCGNP